MSAPLISIRHLNKKYPNGVQALHDVSFDVERGEFLAVIGLSGSGKSTLLRCLNRLTDPSDGEILLDGRRVDNLRGAELRGLRQQTAMIFQHFNLLPRHTVHTNVLMGALAHTPTLKSLFGWFGSEDVANAKKFLTVVGLDSVIQNRADQLSGGQQQRVAIARALCQNPKILLADEPVASLDPATCHVVMEYLRRINQELGLTIICNLHFLSLVREYATRVIALRNGHLVYDGTAANIDRDWFKTIYGEEARDIHVD